jgi:hypothetical protein
MSNPYTATRGPGKPRVTFLRDYCDGKPVPLRRTAHFIQVDIARSGDGAFLIEAPGTPSFAVGEFVLRRWPAFRRRLESALGCRVQTMPDVEWEWTVANRGLAPMTPAAEAWREADLEQFDRDFEKWCEYQQAVGADMTRSRGEMRRA